MIRQFPFKLEYCCFSAHSLEAERKKQLELERQMERQRQMEQQREEERRKAHEQREARNDTRLSYKYHVILVNTGLFFCRRHDASSSGSVRWSGSANVAIS